MREDISHMLNMPEGVRRYRVSPAHWRGGYYEVVATGNGADVIQSIHSHSWREKIDAHFAAYLEAEITEGTMMIDGMGACFILATFEGSRRGS